MSDHKLVAVDICIKKSLEKRRAKFIMKRAYKNFKKKECLRDLANMRWEYVGCEGQIFMKVQRSLIECLTSVWTDMPQSKRSEFIQIIKEGYQNRLQL